MDLTARSALGLMPLSYHLDPYEKPCSCACCSGKACRAVRYGGSLPDGSLGTEPLGSAWVGGGEGGSEGVETVGVLQEGQPKEEGRGVHVEAEDTLEDISDGEIEVGSVVEERCGMLSRSRSEQALGVSAAGVHGVRRVVAPVVCGVYGVRATVVCGICGVRVTVVCGMKGLVVPVPQVLDVQIIFHLEDSL
eukprot:1159047-Pelagomonas_calceolata.AAC.2